MLKRLLFPSLLSSCAFTGCTIGDFDLPEGCDVIISVGARTESDDDKLRAAIECSEGSDCSDRRTIHLGGEIDFSIVLPHQLNDSAIFIEGEPRGFLDIEGFSDETDCRDDRTISGSILFDTVGTGAFIVFADGIEYDRFSLEVQPPDRFEVQLSENGGTRVLDPGEPIVIEGSDVGLHAIIRGPTGDPLVAGPSVIWSLEDGTLAEVKEFGFLGAGASLVGVAAGTTNLTITAGDFEQQFPVEVWPPSGLGGAGGL